MQLREQVKPFAICWPAVSSNKERMNQVSVSMHVYLGLVQERSLYMTPPPQVLEQSDHWDHAVHWPWTARGPCSPYLTH